LVGGLLGVHAPVLPGAQALDGVFLAGHRNVFERVPFDVETFDGFHFYDLDLSYRAYRAGLNCAVALDLLLWHQSGGDFGDTWRHYADRLLAKFPELMPQAPSAPYRTGALVIDPPALAVAYEQGGAACLSVLTDAPSFQGADAFLVAARAAVALPVIRKEFLVDPWQVAESRALGADAILVILAMVDDGLAAELMAEAGRLGMDALVEVHDEAEMARAGRLGARLVGVNNRDLRTFDIDLAITEQIAAQAPEGALLVTESGIFTAADAARLERSGAVAMLVGDSSSTLLRHKSVPKIGPLAFMVGLRRSVETTS